MTAPERTNWKTKDTLGSRQTPDPRRFLNAFVASSWFIADLWLCEPSCTCFVWNSKWLPRWSVLGRTCRYHLRIFTKFSQPHMLGRSGRRRCGPQGLKTKRVAPIPQILCRQKQHVLFSSIWIDWSGTLPILGPRLFYTKTICSFEGHKGALSESSVWLITWNTFLSVTSPKQEVQLQACSRTFATGPPWALNLFIGGCRSKLNLEPVTWERRDKLQVMNSLRQKVARNLQY